MVVSDLHIKFLNRIKISFKEKETLFTSNQIIVHVIENAAFLTALFFFINYCFHHSSNLYTFTEGFSVFLTGFLSTAKNISFTLRKRSFFELNESIKRMSLKVTSSSKEKLENINQFTNKIVQLYYTLVCLTSVFFMCLPTYTFLWATYVSKSNATVIREVPLYAKLLFFLIDSWFYAN